ncbi:MAG: D-2-hydroxyacid dehydrogenase [Tunicatimonas sp.]
MNITFLDRKTLGDVPNLDQLNQLGSVTLHDTTPPEQVVERLRGQQVAITNKVVLDRAILDQLPDLRLICVAATGTNNVDTDYARKRGIAVKNVRDYSTPSVVQVTWTLILTLLQRPPHFNEFVYSGAYSRHDIFTYFDPPFGEVAGKRLGIIGLGTIGKQVAQVGTAFGAEVAYTSSRPDASREPSKPADYVRLPLEELLATSDIVSIHAPLNESTKNIIAYPQLKRMPKHALLINTGRGGIVNEEDLARVIDEGLIGGAGVDVFTQEPLPADHPYLGVKNKSRLLLTPHLGWASTEARTRLLDGVCENIREFQASSS